MTAPSRSTAAAPMTEEKLALLIFEQSEHTSEVGMAKQRLAMNVCQRMAAAIWPKVKSLGTSSRSAKITVAESTALADAIELRRAEGNHGAAIHLQSLFDKLVRAASSSSAPASDKKETAAGSFPIATAPASPPGEPEYTDSDRLDGIEFFGCMTGDCPHETQTECDVAILGVVRSVMVERDAVRNGVLLPESAVWEKVRKTASHVPEYLRRAASDPTGGDRR